KYLHRTLQLLCEFTARDILTTLKETSSAREMLRQKPILDSEVLCVFAAETEQDRIYRTSLDNGLLHSHQKARESHLSIGRWNSHVHYDVPENIGLPRQVFLLEQASQRSIHFLESVEMVLSS